jgi:KDO2-lipid IV(A) lauroyltransferase
MLYALYVTGFSLAKILPLRVAYLIAEAFARGYYLFSRRDKEAVKANLRVALGEDIKEDVLNRHALDIFRNFAKYLADFFKFPRLTREFIDRNITVDGIGYLDECLSEGKGAVLVTLHLGNWELGAAIMGPLNYPTTAIALEHPDRKINDFFKRQRSINQLKSVPVRQRSVDDLKSIPMSVQIKECFRVLRNNGLLAIAADKDYTSTGIYVDFFGRKAVMPKGAAAFSLKTGAPIIVTVLTREEGDKFKFCFEPPIRYEPTGDYEKDLRALMGKYIVLFEKYVRKYPDQWYAFRKIWNHEETTP